ncbi:MAG TPA: hypothetical protein VLU43_18910 [Anaeromyxobacteraceae bacterium]|nr:hypothetical protein [Anaeromyxobacteraceae bacterium]
MRKLASFAMVLGMLGSAGCVTARRPPQIAPGRPIFGPGAPEAYWIWHDGGGWHLRSTTAGMPHRFHGTILPLGGEITDARPIRPDLPDRVRVGPGGITFDLVTQGGEDGFDWHVSSGCNRFEIFIDGAARPGHVRLGGPSNSPQHVPFDRCR